MNAIATIRWSYVPPLAASTQPFEGIFSQHTCVRAKDRHTLALKAAENDSVVLNGRLLCETDCEKRSDLVLKKR
jgi:hypothetical protein